MASVLTGGLRVWDAAHVERLNKQVVKSLKPEGGAVSAGSGSPEPPSAEHSQKPRGTILGSALRAFGLSGHSTSQQSSTPGSPGVEDDHNYLSRRGLLNVIDRPGVPSPVGSTLSLEKKVELALSVGEECITREELTSLFKNIAHPICYDGFEPSGRMHVAQGILKALLVNKLTESGCVFVFWIADWFAMLNNKMDGDLMKIKRVGEYFIEVWKAAGMNMNNVRFLWTSEEIARDPDSYWLRVMDIARHNTINRIKRCSQIMGRGEGDDQPVAQMLYPCMQCADIFYIGADICQLGMDQRKVNMLAREYADFHNSQKKIPYKLKKPIVLSHKMMSGLLEGQAKMSKSDPDSAIFVEDSPEDVRRKIKKAFCPPVVVMDNPCLEYIETLVFPKYGKFEVKRAEKNGGDVVYDSFKAVCDAYVGETLHPGDLKTALAEALNSMLEPIRNHFKTDPHAKAVLADVMKWKVTK